MASVFRATFKIGQWPYQESMQVDLLESEMREVLDEAIRAYPDAKVTIKEIHKDQKNNGPYR